MITYYLHRNYKGNFTLDEKIEIDSDIFGDFYTLKEIPIDIKYIDLITMVKKDYNCKKLILDF